ncbi:MAG: hypothetical protein J6A75_10730 [Lachnospiraceae bacterium]|nr:hypothetical protein [Lachnospiraceae bacterium]
MSIFDEIGIFFTSCAMFADEVVHGSEWELESINEEIKELYKETKQLISKTKRGFTRECNKINAQRKEISDETLRRFAEAFSTLKNIEFEDVIIKIPEVDFQIDEIKPTLVSHKYGMADKMLAMHAPSIGGWMCREIRLLDEIDDAKMELGELEEECAYARRQCAKIQSATHFLRSTYAVCNNLKKMGDTFNEMLEEILFENGVDYRMYDFETRQQIRTIYNLQMALNYFVKESVLTEKGNIRAKYKKYISEANENKKDIVRYLNEEKFYLKEKKKK